MKVYLILSLVLLSLSCSTLEEDDLIQLNGYWEIEKVVFPNGEEKQYRMNATIDYIELDSLQGFRKKLAPRFDGNYETSDDAERFIILKKETSFILAYKNNLSAWQDELISLDDATFAIKNQEGTLYHYKRHQSPTLNP